MTNNFIKDIATSITLILIFMGSLYFIDFFTPKDIYGTWHFYGIDQEAIELADGLYYEITFYEDGRFLYQSHEHTLYGSYEVIDDQIYVDFDLDDYDSMLFTLNHDKLFESYTLIIFERKKPSAS